MANYKKFLSSIASAVVAWVIIVVDSAPTAITSHEWAAGLVLVAGAAGVRQLTNVPPV